MGLNRRLTLKTFNENKVALSVSMILSAFVILSMFHCSKDDPSSIENLPFTIELTTYVDSLSADNSSQAKIWATIKQGNQTVPDSTYVVFQSSLGVIISPIYTQDGLAEATLTAGLKTGTALIAAQAKGVRDSLSIRLIKPDSLRLQLALEMFSIPDTIPADSSSQVVIWCTVNSGDQLVDDGTKVSFETTSGTIEPEALTKDGLARTVLTSGVDDGPATIYAQVLSVRDSITVYFSKPGEFSESISLGLLAIPDTLVVPAAADSIAQSAIWSVVTRGAKPVPNNTKVFFRSTVGSIDSVATITDGLATAILRIPGTVTKRSSTVYVEVLANIDSIKVVLLP
ncbi:hypothetical protein ACFLT7_05185 [candidate division KSB1 bacterium]